jgi:hypothetical protein
MADRMLEQPGQIPVRYGVGIVSLRNISNTIIS